MKNVSSNSSTARLLSTLKPMRIRGLSIGGCNKINFFKLLAVS